LGKQKDWFVFDDCFGTSEEKLLIKYIDKVYEKLKPKYDEIFLVRNERHFKIYNFEDGRAIEPDFVLFLVNHSPEENFCTIKYLLNQKGSTYYRQMNGKRKFCTTHLQFFRKMWHNGIKRRADTTVKNILYFGGL
jgi:type III restriction enzyme